MRNAVVVGASLAIALLAQSLSCGDQGSGSPDAGVAPAMSWVALPGGTFEMGPTGEDGPAADQPRHQVTIQPFEMLRTEVTVAEYRACVEVDACTEPGRNEGYPASGTPPGPPCGQGHIDWSDYDAWGAGRDEHPVSAVTWSQAAAFCGWVGGRLPSEAEWEYAARSGGKENKYPWGEEEPSCDLAIIWDSAHCGACSEKTTWPVCSRSTGDTEQGLCDMAGGMAEWTADCYHFGYNGAPTDGTAWTSDCFPGYESWRVLRGGAFDNWVNPYNPESAQNHMFETTNRDDFPGEYWWYTIGFRCVRQTN